MANGALVGDDDTIQMVRDRLSQPDAKNGAVLDGFPRNLYQADAFEIMLRDELRSNVTAALHFDASKDVVMERILNRGRAEGRADDTVETARVRYEVYLESTAPLIGYYHAKGLRHIIDATPNIEDVSATLMTLLKSL
jgi:adenylate kinase